MSLRSKTNYRFERFEMNRLKPREMGDETKPVEARINPENKRGTSRLTLTQRSLNKSHYSVS